MHKGILLIAVIVALMSVVFLNGASTVLADKTKPTPAPTETVSINFTKIEETSRPDGSPGPIVTLDGRLHLVSQALLDGSTPVGFRLQTNLMNAFASNQDGTETYVAVGSSDGIPAECAEPCLPSFWILTFRLIPRGSVVKPNLLFDLIVYTVYGPDGSLESACVVGQDNCGVIP